MGDPLERDPGMVLVDVENGLLSLDRALNVYCVDIDEKKMTVNADKTEELRKIARFKRLGK
jgi:N-methylhydantoinase B